MIDEIVWANDHSVGIEEVDVQHKHPCEIINRCIKKANGYLLNTNINVILEEIKNM
jgi:hemerythrin